MEGFVRESVGAVCSVCGWQQRLRTATNSIELSEGRYHQKFVLLSCIHHSFVCWDFPLVYSLYFHPSACEQVHLYSKSILGPIYWELAITITGETGMFSLCIPGWVGRKGNFNVYFQRYFVKTFKLSAFLVGIVKFNTVTSRKTRILDGFRWLTQPGFIM